MESSRRFVSLAGVFIGYVLLAEAGLALAGQASVAPPFRPASGLAVAALIALGLRTWPAVLAASVAVAAGVTHDPLHSFASGAGLLIGAGGAAMLIERFADGSDVFRSVRATLRAVAFVIAAAVLPAASITFFGTAADAAGQGWAMFVRAWLGQVTGILVVAPCVLLVLTTPLAAGRWHWPAVGERVALFTMLAAAALIVYAGFIPSDVKTYPLEFLCLPFLLWAAFRFGPREVTLAGALVSGVAVWGTMRGLGPFAHGQPTEAIWLLQAYVAVMSITGIAFATAVDERRRAEAQLHELATTDPLTGLVNYRRLLDVLRQEMARSRRTGRPFAVLLVDMDGLKKINDRHGHLAGSRALCRVADVLRRSTRETDVVSRFGGDEFAIVLPESGDAGGHAVLARVTEKLGGEPASPALSVSGGHAVFPRDGDSATLLLRAADQRLYAAKHGGREVRDLVLAETG